MKFWGPILLLAAAGCSSAPRATAPAPLDRSADAREMVDRLRVQTTWQAPITGGQCVTCWVEMPQGTYIAQGWTCRRACGSYYGWDHSVRWARFCRPIPVCPEW